MIDNLLKQYAQAEKSRLAYLRRRRIIAIVVSCLIFLLGLLLGLYHYTDIICGPPGALTSASQAGEWAMFHHDPAHTGSTAPGIPPQGKIKSVFATGGAIHSSPAVANGIVYFGSRDGYLYALDAQTGDKLWQFETGSWIDSSPAVANGVVYFGSNDAKLYALDAQTGDKLWEFAAEYAIKSSPAVADGIVYFGSTDFFIYALDATTGEKLWHFETENNVTSSPVVVNGIVYIGSMDGYLYTLHATDGRLRLQYQAYSPVAVAPALGEGTVYFGTSKGLLYAVDAKARNWPWENALTPYWRTLYIYGVAPQPPLPSGLLWALNLRGTTNSSPTLLGDSLYLGVDNKLVCVDIQQHKQRWSFETGGLVRSSPAVVDGTVYFGSEDGHLYAVDAQTGDKLWDLSIGDKITSSPALANGKIYIGGQDGKLYIIE